MVFSEIEDAILSGAVEAGVIIHESRFTYEAKGLVKLMDLGKFRERQTGAPIPLGGIVAKRSLDAPLRRELDRLVRRSVEHALGNGRAITDWVRQHAQEMDDAVMRQHIDLYVNEYSVELGEAGKKAVETLLRVYREVNPGSAAARRRRLRLSVARLTSP